MGTRPLEGITVVALEQAVAAPFATRQLADLGARIIKIERPGAGDFARGYDATVRGASSHFTWLNRSKESLTLDIKRPEAADVLQRLLARADVFIHNLAPGAVDCLGLGSESLRPRVPRLIVCALSGYGSAGPGRAEKVYDLLVQGETGFLSITGTADTPSKAGLSIADIAGRHVRCTAASSRRSCSGRRPVKDRCSIFRCSKRSASGWDIRPTTRLYGGSAPPRTGASHATIAPVRTVPRRRWPCRLSRCAERSRMAPLLRRRAGTPERVRPMIASRQTRGGWRTARCCTRSSTRSSRGDRRHDHRAARSGRHRERPDEHGAAVRRSPAVGRARPMARHRVAGRHAASAHPAGHDRRRRTGDEPDSVVGETRRDSRRAAASIATPSPPGAPA